MGLCQSSQNKAYQNIDNKPNKHTIFKPIFPKCPICFNHVTKYINLKNCDHLICKECINLYIKSNFKNISKYPLKCFMNNCDQLIDAMDIKYALNNNKDELFIFDKFSILCALAPEDREECPKCEMIFFHETKWQKKEKQFKWIDDNKRNKCIKCFKEFYGFIVRKHHCRICGEVFCDKCSNNHLPLTASCNKMMKNWIISAQQNKNHQHNKIKIAKNWMKNVAAASTSNDMFKEIQDQSTDDQKLQLDKTGISTQKSFHLSNSDESLIEDVEVRCCHECWRDYYRGVCVKCDYSYCIKCRQEWHNDYDCEEIKKLKKEIQLKNELNIAQNEELMLKEGNRKCAGCNIWVNKTEGCNHMTHQNCSNPNEKRTNKTHFCYCCGELLYDPYHKHEKNGRLHFENGVFENCRKYDKAQRKRAKLKSNVEKHINKVQHDLDKNSNKDDCIVM